MDERIRTPPPGEEPRINGPKVCGARPGRPFLYRVPATGARPMRFSADGLPESLAIDAQTGIIGGQTPREHREYELALRASNAHGGAVRPMRLVVGDTLALTPPMGWSSWHVHYHRVTDGDIRRAADAMIETGMADFGYQYVNIDDCWMVKPDADDPRHGGVPRDERGAIRPNGKFPDMKALTAFIHDRGLKAGIYTSPGPFTCAGYTGSFEHEEIDARTFAEWGFDYLKYDWCSYRTIVPNQSREELARPYRRMSEILRGLDRDLVFSICQYGIGDVWEWGADAGGNCWRTTEDLALLGGGLSGGLYEVGLHNATLHEHAGPGHWNDPDYLLFGRVGDAHEQGEERPTTLTPGEQYTQMSMWCLMAAPLLLSGDITRLDAFTRNVLCNAEVIEIDQDPLGRQAHIISRTEDTLILGKPMADGDPAVGLFNLSGAERSISAGWEELGLSGARSVRDVWRQRELGEFDGAFTATVGPHDVELLRLRSVG
ncbi:MAG: glycoside hydrolase family 27 protein [Planctomycetota bacterium]|nr:glycoside hydrolase family 27 protein [Planctomycetota bacterium]